jgi:hypothetical protein
VRYPECLRIARQLVPVWVKIISADPGEQPMPVSFLLFFVSILIPDKSRLSGAGRSPWSLVPSLLVVTFPRWNTRSVSGSSGSSWPTSGKDYIGGARRATLSGPALLLRLDIV